MTRSLAAACAVLLAACAGTTSEPAPETYEGALPAVAPPLDAITHRLSRVRERLRLRGYRELSRQSRAFVLEGRPTLLPLDLPSDRCSTFVALGSATIRDLRVTMFDTEGDPLASEEVPGEAGLVHVCPQTDAARMPAYLAVVAHEGSGTVALAELSSAPGQGEGFEGVFDDVLAPREPFADVEAALASARAVLRSRGLTSDGAPTIATVAEGGSVHASHTFEPGHCYLVVVRGAASIDDADLFAFDEAGAEVARDIGQGSEPSFERCPVEPETLSLEARVFEGAGALGVQVLVGPAREPGIRDDEADDAVGAALDTPSAATDPSLALGVATAELARLGFAAPLFVAERARIVPGDVVTHEAILGPGCSLVVAAASSDQMDLDLYLADAQGRELDADTTLRSSAVVRACETSPSVRRVAVKAYGRDGTYALAIVRAPDSIGSVEELRAAEAEAPLRARGFVPRTTERVELAEGAPVSRTIEVQPGRCVAVVAAGGMGVRDVDLVVTDASGARLASDTAPVPYASASTCASGQAPLLVTCEVVAFRGTGRATLSVLDDTPAE